MVDTATAKYLSENIGGVLSKALAEMALAQPRDGVDFLASWLKIHVNQEEEKGVREQEEAKLVEERSKAKARREKTEAKEAARTQEAKAKEEFYQELLAKFNSAETTFNEAFWNELLSVASTLAGAKAVYLGFLDEEGLEGAEGPLIRYPHALAGSETMQEQVLAQGQGVTWGALTENPTEEVPHLWRPPMPEPAEPNPDDPDAAVPEVALPPYLPVSISCVTDVPEVRYFDMTRLGSFLAVPLVFSSYYTPEALTAAKAYEEEKKAAALKRQEAQEAYDAAVAEATEKGGEEAAAAVEKPPELEPVEEKPLELPGKTVKMVLCMDTLGNNTAIEESKIELAMELCKACGACKQETEKRQVDAQALDEIDEEAKLAMGEEITAARTRADEETQESITAEESECPPEEEMKKELIGKKWAYLKAARVFLELKDIFLKLTSWVVVPPEMLNIIAATAFMFGYTKVQLYPKRKPNLNWETLVKVLDEDFFTTVQEVDVTAEKKGIEQEQKLAAIKAMLPADYDATKAKELSPAFELLYSLLDAAIAYRTADLTTRKAAYEKQKEEEGEDFQEPPLEEADVDFEGL